MSIPDELMADWFQYISDASEEECQEIKNGLENGSLHPNETKKRLASNIVAFFHGEEAGKAMKEQFENVFKKKEIPDEIPEFKYKRGDLLVSILFDSNLLDSKGEGRRMVKQKAVSIMDGDKIEDSEFTCSEDMAGKIIKVGKRKFLKLL